MLRTLSAFSVKTLLLVLVAMAQLPMAAQDATYLPTRGKRFWAGFMQNGFGAQSLKIHVLSTTATSGTVTIPLTGWSQGFTVGANAVAVIDVPTSAESSGTESVQNKGVLVQSQDSVNVFLSSFQNFTHESTQVLPEPSLGTIYRVDSYQGVPSLNNLHKSEFLVLATQDGTQVQITPAANTAGGHPAGIPFLVDLNAGQTYQVHAAQDNLDLTGSLVEATTASGPCRPFVVLGGSMCGTAPGACQACDHLTEQLVPVTAWGTRYFTVPINGVNNFTYRVMAHLNNTQVSIGGGAPMTLNAGQRYEVNGTNTPVCIDASQPVSVIQILEGYSCAGNGDPSLLLLSPAQRVSNRASFHTPTSPQITQHSVSLVVESTAIGQVTLDGTPVSSSLFQSYAGCTDRMYAKVPVSPGVHRLASTAGFQAYMFGMGYGESYATSAHDIGAIPVQQDSTICGNGTVTLNAPEPLVNAQWTTGSDPSTVFGTGNSITITPTSSESYTVSGLLPVSGCPRTFTYSVGIPLTIPTLLTANGLSTINACQYQPIQLALQPPPDPAWFQIQWSPTNSLNDPASSSPIASPMSSTWYSVSVNSPTGCGDMIDSILVQVQPGQIIELSAAANPTTLCQGMTSQLSSQVLRAIARDDLDAPPSAIWSAIQGGTISSVCGSHGGTALYFNGNGQRYAQTAGLNTSGGGHVRFHLKIANGAAPCDNADPGEDVVLEYSTNNGLNWTNLATYGENNYPTFTGIDAAIPAGAQSANTMFRLRQLANSGAGQDNWAFDTFLIGRYDNTYASYSWSQAGTLNNPNAAATLATPTSSGWYVLSATDPVGGCTYSDSVHVEVAPAFNLTVTPNTTLCSISGLQLSAVPNSGTGIAYSWAPNDGTLSATDIADPVATPTQTTTYNVTANNNAGCIATGSVTLTVGQLFGLVVSASDSTLCQGQSSQLNAAVTGGTGLSYSWSGTGLNDPTIAAPTATPLQTTTYTCTVTHTASGCSLDQSVTIVVNTGYTASAGPDVTVCSALGHQLGVQHNVPSPIYSWTPAANLNASNIQSPTILTDISATYTVTVTDANGCSVSDAIAIVRAYEGVPASQSAAACADVPPQLTAPAPAAGYLWSTGEATPSIIPSSSGPYTVTMTDAQGCAAISTFNVTLHALPAVDLGADLAICGTTPQILDGGNAGSTFLWNTAAQSQSIQVANSGTFSVTVTNANNCSASDAINVQFNAMPVDALQDVTACISSPPTLNAGNNGSTFVWSTSATSQSITPTSSGTYSVTVTTPANCSAVFDAIVDLAPAITVSLGNDTSVCQGQSITLNAGTPGSTYLWSTGATTQTIVANTAGTYSVTVGNGFCSASDALVLATVAAPVDVLQNITQCVDQPAVLNAGNPGCTYAWNTGAATQTLSVGTSGTYTVTVTNPTGCTGNFDAVVQMTQPPVVNLGMDTVLCEGQVLVLDAGNTGATYSWNNGSSAQTLNVHQAGTYTVSVNNGCTRSDAIAVFFNPSPAHMAVKEFHTCLDDEPRYVVIDAGNHGSRFDWSTGATTQVIMASAYGWYYVHVTNAYDCSGSDSARVVEYCPATIFIPNTFTPNGDDINDIFLPLGKSIATMQLLVFDRWGEQIFASDDPEMGWDGTYKGEFVKNDMYIWRLQYSFYTDKDGTIGPKQNQVGNIQVLR